MPIAPTDIFDRTAGWGHTAGTNYNFSTATNVVVQAAYANPTSQPTIGDDLGLQDTTHLPVLAAIAGKYALDGAVAATALPVTAPTATANSTTNGVTTTPVYSTKAEVTPTLTIQPNQGEVSAIVADRTAGFGHNNATVLSQVYGGSAVINTTFPGASTLQTKPYDGNGATVAATAIPAINQVASSNFGGIFDRVKGYGHVSAGYNVTIAGTSTAIPAQAA